MYSHYALVDLWAKLHQKVIKLVGICILNIVDGITNIQVKRHNRNNMADNLPSVVAHELIKISTAVYSKYIVDKYLQQLH